ncbi:GntR family transcriptional regulator [Amycolatopsis pigmentata]|uniref:GntR family transcriptional regulator n=1 Tax=Amycolatopsis pigmentata TaxID=450801 RepID=A0ABW5G1Z5_9PSEU
MRETKASRVYDEVRADIVGGRLAPGSVLDEGELAAAFEVSRTPVREALRALQRDGLVRSGARRQLFVLDLSEQQREVAALRAALEGTAVTEACTRCTPEDLDDLRLNVIRQRRLARAGNSEGFLELDEEFHRRLAGVARMPVLSMLLGQLGAFVRLARAGEPTETEHMLSLADEHDQIVDLLEARDTKRLRAALLANIDNTPRRAGPARHRS